ncbi:MAG: EAL domain-containing protein [Cyanobacteria bacterium J06648_16]
MRTLTRFKQRLRSLMMGSALLSSAVLGIAVSGAWALPETAADPPTVLVIHSYHADLSWTSSLKSGIDSGFEGANVRVFHEYLDAKRYPQLAHGERFLQYLDRKYEDAGVDVLLVSDDPGLLVMVDHRDDWLETIPLVFLGINHVEPALLTLAGATGVFETHSVAETAAEALRQTETDTLIVVNDSSETGQANQERLEAIRQMPNAPERIVIVNDLQLDQIKQRFQAYPSDWPIFLMGQLRHDSVTGPLVEFVEGAEALRAQLPNPIYSHTEMLLGSGIVGGKLLDGEHHARQAVQLTQRILNGENPDDIPPIQTSENLWMFDAQELARFDIDSTSLPYGSKLVNEEVSFYQRYRQLVWMTAGAFTSSVLIIFLLIEIIRRRAAAAKILQENEQRYRDLAESGADLFWETDTALCFRYLSGKLPFLQTMPPEDLLGMPLKEAVALSAEIDFDVEAFQRLTYQRQLIEGFTFRFRETPSTVRIFKLNGRPIYDAHRQYIGYRGIQREITEEYQLSETIAYQATYDSLTGLINRNEFDTRLKDSVMRSRSHQTHSVLCYLDLDQFKIVNDTAGHLVGDQLLAELAHLLKQSVRLTDSLGRLGGDEFGLILEGCTIEDGSKICETLINKIQTYRFKWQNRQFNVGVSIGMVPIQPDAANPIELLSRADLACYKAKDLGRGRIYIADHDDAELDMRQSQMARIANISQAIEENRFFLVQQPIQSLFAFNKRPHVEILLRLNDESGEVISPGQFIPVAERYGLISLIDRWVLETVVKNYDQLFDQPNTLVSINLSGSSLSDDRFIDFAQSLICQSHIDPHCVCFEITETAAISHLDQATKFIKAMKAIGVRFALDDFGSGVSSFGYLRSLPVDYLKIDGALVRNITQERCDRTIVDLINQVAHMLGMRTIAEFVEDAETLKQLRLLEVDYAQGYEIGRPVPLDGVIPAKLD